jgi:tRNA (guanine37-N1)-methyltransferase
MRVDAITLFPEMVELIAAYGVTGRAIEQGYITLKTWNPRDFSIDKHRSVDARPYGGGPGMVMQVEPLQRCIQAVRMDAAPQVKVIYLSPQGRCLDQKVLQIMARAEGLILVTGRYEGIDERLIELEVDEEWSIGDYVLSGGELAAMVMIDAIARLQPGALGHEESAQQDSFMDNLLDYPHYTRPYEIEGLEVPQILLSGDHAQIRRWRHKQALGRTAMRRPDLLRCRGMTETERTLLDEFIREQDKIAGVKKGKH